MSNRFLFVSLLLGSLTVCGSLIAGYFSLARSASPQATAATPVSQSSTPTTLAKTTTIQVGGRPQTIPLDFVQTDKLTAYFPSDRFALEQGSNSYQKRDVTFYWKNPDGTLDRNTNVTVEILDKTVKLRDAIQAFDDLSRNLEPAGVQTIKQSSSITYAKKAYSTWLRDAFRWEKKSSDWRVDISNDAATTYIGEANGQVFLVTSSYAPRYSDEFTSREDVILKNLKVENGIK